jgi:hypothetical protein
MKVELSAEWTRVVLLCFSLLHALIFSGVVNGWVPIHRSLLHDGVHTSLCPNATATDTATASATATATASTAVCPAQGLLLQRIYITASTAMVLGNLPMGLVLDMYGPRVAIAAAALLSATGSAVFSFSDASGDGDGYLAGMAMMAVATSAYTAAGVQVSALFPRQRGVVVTLFPAAMGLGALVFQVMGALVRAGSVTTRGFFMGYAVAAAGFGVLGVWLHPARPYRIGEKAFVRGLTVVERVYVDLEVVAEARELEMGGDQARRPDGEPEDDDRAVSEGPGGDLTASKSEPRTAAAAAGPSSLSPGGPSLLLPSSPKLAEGLTERDMSFTVTTEPDEDGRERPVVPAPAQAPEAPLPASTRSYLTRLYDVPPIYQVISREFWGLAIFQAVLFVRLSYIAGNWTEILASHGDKNGEQSSLTGFLMPLGSLFAVIVGRGFDRFSPSRVFAVILGHSLLYGILILLSSLASTYLAAFFFSAARPLYQAGLWYFLSKHYGFKSYGLNLGLINLFVGSSYLLVSSALTAMTFEAFQGQHAVANTLLLVAGASAFVFPAIILTESEEIEK